MRSSVSWAVVAALVALTGAGCAEPPATVGSAEATPFVGTTCDELGREVGQQLDARMLEILDGPESANGESRSVRASAWQMVIADDLNHRLRELGIRDDCTAAGMLRTAEGEFSPAMMERVGSILYDAPQGSDETWTYEEWRAEARRALSVIDGD